MAYNDGTPYSICAYDPRGRRANVSVVCPTNSASIDGADFTYNLQRR